MNKSQLALPVEELAVPSRDSALWRPIHYLGSKLRIVEHLRLAIDQVDPHRGVACDLFAGSGTVAAALSSTRDVTAVDIQEYSRVLCSALLDPGNISAEEAGRFVDRAFDADHHERLGAAAPLIEYERKCLDLALRGEPEPICQLIEHASIAGSSIAGLGQTPRGRLQAAQRSTIDLLAGMDERHTVILRHYGGLFFSYLQAVALDSLLIAAHTEGTGHRDTFLAAIISTASEIVNTVGKHFAQPIRARGPDGAPKRYLTAKIVRDRQMDVASLFSEWLARYRSLPRTGRKHRAIRADFVDALAAVGSDIDVIYADPPYTRDHYSRFYHVLETMCLWDNPGVSTTRIRAETDTLSRGMYRADRHQSPFCIKSKAPAAFQQLFGAARDLRVPLVLSYSPYAVDKKAHPRVMTVEHIDKLAKKHFNHVEKISAGRLRHMKLNATHLHIDASAEAELIFLCS